MGRASMDGNCLVSGGELMHRQKFQMGKRIVRNHFVGKGLISLVQRLSQQLAAPRRRSEAAESSPYLGGSQARDLARDTQLIGMICYCRHMASAGISLHIQPIVQDRTDTQTLPVQTSFLNQATFQASSIHSTFILPSHKSSSRSLKLISLKTR